jgi:hypothetical protein
MAPSHIANQTETCMSNHEKQSLESESRESMESHFTRSEPDENAAPHKSAANWDGYSLEILSIWFDP